MNKRERSQDKVNFNANGKILLTGEYLIMDGALALALPVSFGQSMVLSHEYSVYDPSNTFKWIASDVNGVWFSGDFAVDDFSVVSTSDSKIANTLQSLLLKAASLNPLHNLKAGMVVRTHLNFNRFFGLGSSSTLISLVADLFETDKYKLHHKVSGGSGYDVACASYNHPLLFSRSGNEAVVKPINFNPPFDGAMWFIYLGNKQDTNSEISKYKGIAREKKIEAAGLITDITTRIAETKDLTTFVSLIDLHEEIISSVLGRERIKHQYFNDFNGSVKSLGAWGGDFVLAVSEMGDRYVSDYFQKHNIYSVFRFNELVLNEPVSDNNAVIIRF